MIKFNTGFCIPYRYVEETTTRVRREQNIKKSELASKTGLQLQSIANTCTVKQIKRKYYNALLFNRLRASILNVKTTYIIALLSLSHVLLKYICHVKALYLVQLFFH